MAVFDQAIHIQAPPSMVWAEALYYARKGSVQHQDPHRLIVATEAMLSYVYALEEQADGSTRLRHVVESGSRVHVVLHGAHDLDAALDTLAVSRTDTAGRTALGETLASVLSLSDFSPDALAEDRMAQIRKKAERAARGAQWAPRPVVAELPPAPATETASVPQAADERPATRPPWQPRNLVAMSAFFSFVAAGILAGVNWRRLGKPQWTWPTILLSIVALVGLVVLSGTLDLPRAAVYGINIALGAVLTYLQTPAYKEWAAAHGEPTVKESGCLIPIAIGVGTVVLTLVFAFAIAVLQEIARYAAATGP